MIICFEGPSAVGKTRLSHMFSEDFLVIPEVNECFTVPETKSKFWYYEQQVERYRLASQAEKHTILDGDVFQPLWYNWIYDYPAEFPSFAETRGFYFESIQANKLAFPDVYIILQAGVDTLKMRKESDETRKRRNFEKHLRLIEPQKKYFEFLNRETAIEVCFIEQLDVNQSLEKVLNVIDSVQPKKTSPISSFNKIIRWLKNSGAEL